MVPNYFLVVNYPIFTAFNTCINFEQHHAKVFVPTCFDAHAGPIVIFTSMHSESFRVIAHVFSQKSADSYFVYLKNIC